MYKNLVDKILYILSLFFLIGSIIAYFSSPEEFNWEMLFGTDGLTLFGLIFTLITLISMKIPFIRKIITSILLKSNILKMRYQIAAIVDYDGVKKIDYFLDSFVSSISASHLYDNHDYEVFNKEVTLIRIFSPAMNSHLLIKQLPASTEDDYYEDEIDDSNKRRWKIELSGKENYREFEKNTKFLLNTYFESLQQDNFHFDKFNLVIIKKNTEYNLVDKGILLNSKKYKISDSRIEIQSNQHSTILIDRNIGISISSRTKGEFANSIDILKNILVS